MAAVLAGALAAATIVRAVLDWILGLEGPGVGVAVIVAAVLGGVASLGDARALRPLSDAERRDALLCWGALTGGVAALACLLLPLPWGPLAAATVVGVTVLGLRRV